MEEKIIQERKVIHLFLKESNKHEYFGSVSAIYDVHSIEEIGITHGSLRNYVVAENKPYENSKVIIRRGDLVTKKKK